MATGIVDANPQLYPNEISGGATQGVIDVEQFGDCLTATCYTSFPNGSGR